MPHIEREDPAGLKPNTHKCSSQQLIAFVQLLPGQDDQLCVTDTKKIFFYITLYKTIKNVSHKIFYSDSAEMLCLFLCLSCGCAETQGNTFSLCEIFLLFWELEIAEPL